MEKQVTIAVRKNENGEITDVFAVKTYNEEIAKQMKNSANSYKANAEKTENDLRAKQIEREKKTENQFSKHSLLIAKCLFNDLCDKGLAHTTNEFETMFANYLLNGGLYNQEFEPRDFKKILEGVR